MPKLSEAGKKALDELIAQTVEEGRLPGFALAISNVDELIYSNAGGRYDYEDPNSAQADVDTSVFWMCSCTKILASLAALKLIEQGKLSYSTPVSTYFPIFKDCVVLENPYTDPSPKLNFVKATKEITVEHLFTHTSGLYYLYKAPEPGTEHVLGVAYTQSYEEGEEKYDKFWNTLKGDYPGIPLLYEPGDAFSYGVSSDVLGFIVEKISGQTLEDFTQENIFKPLGVKTSYRLTAETSERLIRLHFRNKDGSVEGWKDRAPVLQRYPEITNMFLGGIGVYTTLPDYIAILRHLLQIEAGRDVPNAIFKRSTVQSIFQPRIPAVPQAFLTQFLAQLGFPYMKDLNWGGGFCVNTTDWEGRRKKGSGFWSGWAGTWYFVDPTTGVALLFGSQIVPAMDVVTGEIADKAEQILYANLID